MLIKPKQYNITSKNIYSGNLLSYRDDIYCEIVRPTYSLFYISYFLIGGLIILLGVSFVVILIGIAEAVPFILSLLGGIFFVIYILFILISKDFAQHLRQPYYQPIVFNRVQKKIYVYYKDNKANINTVMILNMADVTPFIEVKCNSIVTNQGSVHGARISGRVFLEANVSVRDRNQKEYIMFQEFTQFRLGFFNDDLQENQDNFFKEVENKLSGYWNWCEAYMNYQDEKLIDTKTTKHFFRGIWSKEIHQQFTKGD